MPPKSIAQRAKEKAANADANPENDFENIDNGDLSQNGDGEIQPDLNQGDGADAGDGETKEGDQIRTPRKHSDKPRERRKPASIEEMRQLARLMTYEDRAAVIGAIRDDMRQDIQTEREAEEKAAQEKADKLARLSNLQNGI